MTNNDIIDMARNSGFPVDEDGNIWCDYGTYNSELYHFATLASVRELRKCVALIKELDYQQYGLYRIIDALEERWKDG